jgi:predicted O-methyltransferase YrrM
MNITTAFYEACINTNKKLPPTIRVILREALYLVTWHPSAEHNQFVREKTRFFIRHTDELEAVMNPVFISGLLQQVYNTEGKPGDIIELGTYKGGSAVMIARLLNVISSRRTLYACDTFQGLPYDDKFTAKTKVKGLFSDTSISYVYRKFRRFKVSERIKVVQGLFEESLSKKLNNKMFSLAFIDCDLYDSTRYCLDFLKKRMQPGGIIVIHDYGDRHNWGCTKAVDDWCEITHSIVNKELVPHIHL